jgi:hypothetical protein
MDVRGKKLNRFIHIEKNQADLFCTCMLKAEHGRLIPV